MVRLVMVAREEDVRNYESFLRRRGAIDHITKFVLERQQKDRQEGKIPPSAEPIKKRYIWYSLAVPDSFTVDFVAQRIITPQDRLEQGIECNDSTTKLVSSLIKPNLDAKWTFRPRLILDDHDCFLPPGQDKEILDRTPLGFIASSLYPNKLIDPIVIPRNYSITISFEDELSRCLSISPEDYTDEVIDRATKIFKAISLLKNSRLRSLSCRIEDLSVYLVKHGERSEDDYITIKQQQASLQLVYRQATNAVLSNPAVSEGIDLIADKDKDIEPV